MAEAGEKNTKVKLYSYWRSSCSYRVRIALNLKGIEYEYKAVNLVKGEQFGPEFQKLNPIGYVPVLVDGDVVISDSFAILMYLEEKYPQHPILPADLKKRALNYQVANIVGSSIQPLQNLAVLKYIEEKVHPDEKISWVQSHIGKGFTALEKLLKDQSGKYATGDDICMGDLFIAPQAQAAFMRFNMDPDFVFPELCQPAYGTFDASALKTQYPLLSRLYEEYSQLPAFQLAMPENQPDAPRSTA